jgi:hypothetical protein
MKNGRATDELGASDSEDNCDDSCEAVIPKFGEVLEHVNKMMTWVEPQTDRNTFICCHLVNIKQYVLGRGSSAQTTLHDYFHN